MENFLIVEKSPKKIPNCLFESKYKPTNLKQYIGNKQAIKTLQTIHKKKPIFIYGPHGIGKSLLAQLFLQETHNIIEIDDIQEKNKFFEKLKKIITSKPLQKPSAIIIENIDTNIGEGVYFNKFIETIEKWNSTPTPIICICTGENIKKKYKISKNIELIKLEYPETQEMQKFCSSIASKEEINLCNNSIDLIISASRYDFRKILHFFKLITIGKHKKKYTTKDIIKIIEFSEADTVYSAYEIIEEIFNDNIDKNIEELTRDCYPDQPLINDIIYSNATNGIDLQNTFNILNGFSISDTFQKHIFKNQSWQLRDYSIINGSINAFHIIKQKSNKKHRKIKKNQLNNLPWICAKNNITLTEYTKNTSLNTEETLFTFKNIIIPLFHPKIENKTLTEENIKELQQYGIHDASLFSKLWGLTYKKPITRKNKTFLEKIFKQFNT